MLARGYRAPLAEQGAVTVSNGLEATNGERMR
jgi:hypothetical protein